MLPCLGRSLSCLRILLGSSSWLLHLPAEQLRRCPWRARASRIRPIESGNGSANDYVANYKTHLGDNPTRGLLVTPCEIVPDTITKPVDAVTVRFEHVDQVGYSSRRGSE